MEDRPSNGPWLPDRRGHHQRDPRPRPHKRWRVLYIDEIDDVTTAHDTRPWGTADNYNPTHPFPVIDQILAAVD